jgi:AcrR family transcriptional regulator
VVDDDRTWHLPKGLHGIPPALIARNQRERLIAAVAEACTEYGYAEVTVVDLTKRAGVSTVTFYKLFADKQECAREAYRELLGRLLEEVDRACAGEGEPEAKVRVGIRTVLDLFAADPPTARLLSIEVMALGPGGFERYNAAIEMFVSRLRVCRESGDDSSIANADWTLVAGISMLIGKRVVAGEAATLPQLEDELVGLALFKP